jgi:protein ImuA
MATTDSVLTAPDINRKMPCQTKDKKLNDNTYFKNNFVTKHSGRKQKFACLRHQVATLDGQMMRPRLRLGVDSLDSALGGGLALGRVHMLCAGQMAYRGALTGFAVCLLRQLLALPDNDGPIVWCPSSGAGAGGMIYAAGMAALGLDPDRLLIVDTPSPTRRLAVLEDILRTNGLAAVIAEYDGARQSADYWMRLARRTQLAAEASGTTGFILGWPSCASGFESLWNIAPVAAYGQATEQQNMWQNIWQIELRQARGGRAHDLILAWDAVDNMLSEWPSAEVADSPRHAPELPWQQTAPALTRESNLVSNLASNLASSRLAG